MKIKKMKLEDIKPADYNPRVISDYELDKLKKSIHKFGYVEPIIYNKRTGNIVGGNQRYKALKELGINEVEVVEVDLSKDEEVALNVALNKISGDWDNEKLSIILEDLKNKEMLDFTGFNEKDMQVIQDLINSNNLKEYSEKEIDENIETKNKCPKCGYEW